MTMNVLEYGPRRRVIEFWKNDTGVTLAHNADPKLAVLLAPKATSVVQNAYPCFWTPSGTYAAGTSILGETGTASTITEDTITVGPWQSKHVFRIPVEGASRMFIEWRGEVVSASGFAASAGAVDGVRRFFWSYGGGWATGTLFDDPALGSSYLNLPQNLCYNSAQYGANASVMAGLTYDPAGTSTTSNPWGIVGGMQLIVRGWQTMDSVLTTTYSGPQANALNFAFRSQMGKMPNEGGSTLALSGSTPAGPLSQGGLLWGYTLTNTATSRFPTAGDRLGWIYEIGYPKSMTAYNQGSGNTPIDISDLAVSGLGSVYCSFFEAGPWNADSAQGHMLVFTGATMAVKGTMRAILVYDTERT